MTEQTIKGETPNGGVYSTAYFLDAAGEPAEREDAVSVMIVEYDTDGNAIFRTYGQFKAEVTEDAGLVEREVTVHRDGKTFKQKRMVRAGDPLAKQKKLMEDRHDAQSEWERLKHDKSAAPAEVEAARVKFAELAKAVRESIGGMNTKQQQEVLNHASELTPHEEPKASTLRADVLKSSESAMQKDAASAVKATKDYRSSVEGGKEAEAKYVGPDHYKKWNAGLREDADTALKDPDVKAMQELASKPLGKPMTLFRGVKGDAAKEIGAAKVGDTVVHKGFASTTYDLDTADQFAGDSDTMVVVKAKTGHVVREHEEEGESEVVQRHGVKWKVVDKRSDESVHGYKFKQVIYVEEA